MGFIAGLWRIAENDFPNIGAVFPEHLNPAVDAVADIEQPIIRWNDAVRY
jgi:hypothetical protein